MMAALLPFHVTIREVKTSVVRVYAASHEEARVAVQAGNWQGQVLTPMSERRILHVEEGSP